MSIFILFWPITLPLLIGYLFALRKLFEKQNYVVLSMVALAPFVVTEAVQYHWFSKVVPAQIGITYPVSINDEGGFREGCGTAVFKISEETLEAIRKNGLNAFLGATQARGHPHESYYKYKEWKETPVPPSWLSEGSWMICSGLSNENHARIVAAAREKGAYYTTKNEAQLIVIPSLGYVVFSFFG